MAQDFSCAFFMPAFLRCNAPLPHFSAPAACMCDCYRIWFENLISDLFIDIKIKFLKIHFSKFLPF